MCTAGQCHEQSAKARSGALVSRRVVNSTPAGQRDNGAVNFPSIPPLFPVALYIPFLSLPIVRTSAIIIITATFVFKDFSGTKRYCVFAEMRKGKFEVS